MPKIPLALRAVPLCKVGNLFATLTSATIFLCGYAEKSPWRWRAVPLYKVGNLFATLTSATIFLCGYAEKSPWRWRAVPLYKVGNLFATLTSATIFRDRRFVHHIHLCHNFILTPNTIKHASAQN